MVSNAGDGDAPNRSPSRPARMLDPWLGWPRHGPGHRRRGWVNGSLTLRRTMLGLRAAWQRRVPGDFGRKAGRRRRRRERQRRGRGRADAARVGLRAGAGAGRMAPCGAVRARSPCGGPMQRPPPWSIRAYGVCVKTPKHPSLARGLAGTACEPVDRPLCACGAHSREASGASTRAEL